jgi:hypothetical protein
VSVPVLGDLDVLPAHEARVLAALLHVYARDGRATVRTVARAAGRSVGPTHKYLARLADRGLVAGIGDGVVRTGALRPLVWPVEIPRGDFSRKRVRVDAVG